MVYTPYDLLEAIILGRLDADWHAPTLNFVHLLINPTKHIESTNQRFPNSSPVAIWLDSVLWECISMKMF